MACRRQGSRLWAQRRLAGAHPGSTHGSCGSQSPPRAGGMVLVRTLYLVSTLGPGNLQYNQRGLGRVGCLRDLSICMRASKPKAVKHFVGLRRLRAFNRRSTVQLLRSVGVGRPPVLVLVWYIRRFLGRVLLGGCVPATFARADCVLHPADQAGVTAGRGRSAGPQCSSRSTCGALEQHEAGSQYIALRYSATRQVYLPWCQARWHILQLPLFRADETCTVIAAVL